MARALSGSAFSYKEVPLPRGKAKWKLRTWEQKIQNEFSKGKQPQRRINGPWPLERQPELPGSLSYEALPTDPGGPPPPPQCPAEMFPVFNTTDSPPTRTASPHPSSPRFPFPSTPNLGPTTCFPLTAHLAFMGRTVCVPAKFRRWVWRSRTCGAFQAWFCARRTLGDGWRHCWGTLLTSRGWRPGVMLNIL